MYAMDTAGLVKDARALHERGVLMVDGEPEAAFVALPVLAPRMAGQSGLFSWQRHPWERLDQQLGATVSSRLRMFPIAAGEKSELIKRLAQFGIDAASLYGDLGGVGRAASWRYTHDQF